VFVTGGGGDDWAGSGVYFRRVRKTWLENAPAFYGNRYQSAEKRETGRSGGGGAAYSGKAARSALSVLDYHGAARNAGGLRRGVAGHRRQAMNGATWAAGEKAVGGMACAAWATPLRHRTRRAVGDGQPGAYSASRLFEG